VLYGLLIESGESGGGKSSIHSLLLRYYDPVRGKVTYDGQGASGFLDWRLPSMSEFADIREFMPESWRNIIGVVPQVDSRYE
jgi:ABC-type multidrug transport system fused ATPase/permease subunit